MKLRDLFSDGRQMGPAGGGGRDHGLTWDSRMSEAGRSVFALAGSKTRWRARHRFGDCGGRGGGSGRPPPQGDRRWPFVRTSNPRRALACGVEILSRQPKRSRVRHRYKRQDLSRTPSPARSGSGSVTTRPHRTIGLGCRNAPFGSLTTPDPIAMHSAARRNHRRGRSALAFEASSHGSNKYRQPGVSSCRRFHQPHA